jgi:hypothetical protein
MCERLRAAGDPGRTVAREIVERGGENGTYVKLSGEVDDVDGRGDLVARIVVAIEPERHTFAAIPVRESGWEVGL